MNERSADQTIRPSVFDYQDYRQFIQAMLKYRKSSAPKGSRVTVIQLAKEAGFKSLNLLGRILKGQRNLNGTYILSLARAMKLNQKETSFFGDLVHLNQARNSNESSYYSQRIVASRNFQKANPLTPAQARYLKEWHLPAIRELVETRGFKDDPEWIAKRLHPHITPHQARLALDDLIKMGLLYRDDQGKIHQKDTAINVGNQFISPFVKEYHRAMIKRGLESVDMDKNDRNLQGATLSLSKERQKELWELITRFREEVSALAEEDRAAEGVFQINFQMFPLAYPEENGG